jgi:hypothetical protein
MGAVLTVEDIDMLLAAIKQFLILSRTQQAVK